MGAIPLVRLEHNRGLLFLRPSYQDQASFGWGSLGDGFGLMNLACLLEGLGKTTHHILLAVRVLHIRKPRWLEHFVRRPALRHKLVVLHIVLVMEFLLEPGRYTVARGCLIYLWPPPRMVYHGVVPETPSVDH